MLIDINIKIADNDGKVVHHFEKRFDDENFACLENLNGNYLGESFENFLSEYMTSSGQVVRDKLISKSISSSERIPNFSSDQSILSGNDAFTDYIKSEIEYKIRIGNNNVYSGKMPLTQTTNTIIGESPSYHKDPQSQPTSSLYRKAGTLDNIINYAMQKAIEKYEVNSYHLYMDEDNENLMAKLSEQTEDIDIGSAG